MPQPFGIVADPYVADVGLDRANPLKHPPHMVGQSIMLPVGDAFRIAKRMWPGLTKIGVAWNRQSRTPACSSTRPRRPHRGSGSN
jgi:hypothetical protein